LLASQLVGANSPYIAPTFGPGFPNDIILFFIRFPYFESIVWRALQGFLWARIAAFFGFVVLGFAGMSRFYFPSRVCDRC